MSDIVERLLEPDRHDPKCPFKNHCYCDDGAPHDTVSHPFAAEAAGTIIALRKEVEAAKADAALARQGYETAYAEFDDKCRTVNRLVVERNTLRRLLIKYGDRVRMATSNDDQHVIDDAFAASQEPTP